MLRFIVIGGFREPCQGMAKVVGQDKLCGGRQLMQIADRWRVSWGRGTGGQGGDKRFLSVHVYCVYMCVCMCICIYKSVYVCVCESVREHVSRFKDRGREIEEEKIPRSWGKLRFSSKQNYTYSGYTIPLAILEGIPASPHSLEQYNPERRR